MDKFIIGTRGSALALKQTETVARTIKEAYPHLEIETKVIKTTGDKIKEVSLAPIGSKGLFVKEIEEALLAGEIDVAVHSLKDLPTLLPKGLMLGAVSLREDPREAWISAWGHTIDALPPGGLVGTSSLRRVAQLNHYRSDLKPVPLRGNLNTRLKKARDYGAIVVALAGLKRLNMDNVVTDILSPEICLPAVGQGALGLEIREGDGEVAETIACLHHPETYDAVLAERAFLRRLEGGCQVPVAAWGRLDREGNLVLTGVVADTSGTPFYKEHIRGSRSHGEMLGVKLAEQLFKMGAGKTLQEVRKKEEGNG